MIPTRTGGVHPAFFGSFVPCLFPTSPSIHPYPRRHHTRTTHASPSPANIHFASGLPSNPRNRRTILILEWKAFEVKSRASFFSFCCFFCISPDLLLQFPCPTIIADLRAMAGGTGENVRARGAGLFLSSCHSLATSSSACIPRAHTLASLGFEHVVGLTGVSSVLFIPCVRSLRVG